jgi:hypothetical protein
VEFLIAIFFTIPVNKFRDLGFPFVILQFLRNELRLYGNKACKQIRFLTMETANVGNGEN